MDDLADLPTPSPAVRKCIHRVWDELADFPAPRIDDAVHHLLDGVAGLIHAQNAYWLGVVRVTRDQRDALQGWRPRVIRYLRSTPEDEAFGRRAIRDNSRGRVDPASIEHVKQAGRHRAFVRRDLVDASWFESEHFKEEIAPRGIVDTLFVIFPINDSAESYYGFHRIGRVALFSDDDRHIAGYAMRGLKWFHRQVMLSHGLLVANAPLSPMEHRIVTLLLSERSERQIAAELDHSAKTTHKYVTEIFRRFGVTSRAGLMALWLGKAH